jgi:hypothetical protein
MELVGRSIGRSVGQSFTLSPKFNATEKKIILNHRYVQHGNKETPHHSCYKIKLIKYRTILE